MKQIEQELKAFLSERLQIEGISPDSSVLNELIDVITLREGLPDMNKQKRSIALEEESDGSISATRFSGYNLLELSFSDVLDLILEGGIIATMGQASKLAYIFAIASLINEFVKKLSIQLNKQDAKVLLAIHRNGEKRFKVEALLQIYNKEFGEAISYEQLERRLGVLKKALILRYKGDKVYQLREHLEHDRS